MRNWPSIIFRIGARRGRDLLNLAVFQHDEESTVRYKIGAHDTEERIVDTSEEAIDLFRKAIEV